MPQLREYLISITAAAIICTCLPHIVGIQSSAGKIIKIMSGLFLTFTAISPIFAINLSDFDISIEDFKSNSQKIIEEEMENSQTVMADIILEQTQAYILDEGKKLGLNLKVEIILSDSNPPVPKKALITGDASPYNKNILNHIISDNLDIDRENISWT